MYMQCIQWHQIFNLLVGGMSYDWHGVFGLFILF